MAIKRYVASQDNTITNAFNSTLLSSQRGTGSNMGAADVLEVFSIYGEASSSNGLSSELSRILIQFPIDSISSDRTAGTIPASGSVSFYLRAFNAEHPFSVPSGFTLSASALTRDWEEGFGLDMEGYRDETKEGAGANWQYASTGTSWTRNGGDYDFNRKSTFDQTFTK